MMPETTLPASKKIPNTSWYDPLYPKQAKQHGPHFLSKRTMQQQVINIFTALLAQTTLIHNDKTTFS
jgi:hypothetical protein